MNTQGNKRYTVTIKKLAACGALFGGPGLDSRAIPAHLEPGFKPEPASGEAHLIPGFKPEPKRDAGDHDSQ